MSQTVTGPNDRLKPGTKVFHQRQMRWRHNGFFGSVRMSHMQMQAIINSPTTTPLAKKLAWEIRSRLGELNAALKVRIDEK